MTQLLQQAFGEVQKLPESEQDAIAAMILEELAEEERWQQKFAASKDKLAKLAEKALQDIQAGRVLKVGIDEL